MLSQSIDYENRFIPLHLRLNYVLSLFTLCILYVLRNFVQCSDSFHTHTDSCLQPHPANIESAWLLSQACYHSKTKRSLLTLYIPLRWFPLSAFFLLSSLHHYPHSPLTHVQTQPQPALIHRLWVDFAHYSCDPDNSHMTYYQSRTLPAHGWDKRLNFCWPTPLCLVQPSAHFFTFSVKKIAAIFLSCSNRRLVVCSISSAVQG